MSKVILGQKLRYARQINEMSQEDVSQKTKIPKSCIYDFELGERNPSSDQLSLLADALFVQKEWITNGQIDYEEDDEFTENTSNMELEDKLKLLRINNGYNISQVAKAIGIERTAYSRIESGKRKASVAILKKISEFFNVSLDSILNTEVDNHFKINVGKDVEDLIMEIMNAEDKHKKAIVNVWKEIKKL